MPLSPQARTGILAVAVVGGLFLVAGGAVGVWLLSSLTAGPPTSGRVDVAGSPLRWSAPVTEAEAVRLGRYLETQGPERNAAYGLEIRRSGATYEYRMAVKTGLDKDETYVRLVKQFARQLSRDVFGGQPVDIHLCDESMKTIRVVVPIPRTTD